MTTQEILANIVFEIERSPQIDDLPQGVQDMIQEAVRHLRQLDLNMLPCPFCGGVPIMEKVIRQGYEENRDDQDAYAYYAVCHACACQGGWAKTQGNARRNWNMRTPNNGVNADKTRATKI